MASLGKPVQRQSVAARKRPVPTSHTTAPSRPAPRKNVAVPKPRPGLAHRPGQGHGGGAPATKPLHHVGKSVHIGSKSKHLRDSFGRAIATGKFLPKPKARKAAPTTKAPTRKPPARKGAAKAPAPSHKPKSSPVTRPGSSSSVTGGGVASPATDPSQDQGGSGIDLGKLLEIGAIAAIAILLVIYLRRHKGGKRRR